MVFNKHNILNCNSVIVLCNFKRINPIEKLNLFHKRRRVISLTSILESRSSDLLFFHQVHDKL